MSLTKTFQGLKASTSSKNISSTCYARLRAGHFHIMSSPQENFPIKGQKNPAGANARRDLSEAHQHLFILAVKIN